MASTGTSIRRSSGPARYVRWARMTATARKSSADSTSRSGRTKSCDERGRGVPDREGVGWAVDAARRPRRGLGVVLHDERGGEVEQAYESDGRRHRHARGRRRQPARREREQQVDDHDLDDPHGDPPDAVEGRVVGLRKDGERPQRARGDQDGREPILAPRQRREADADGGRDHQGAGHGGPRAVPGRCLGEGQDHRAGAQRGGRDRQDHDRPGRQAPLWSSLHGVTLRPRRWCRRGCRPPGGEPNIDVLAGWPERVGPGSIADEST